MNNYAQILQEKGLRKTNFRLELLELFYSVSSSLSVEEIRGKIESKTDKVTVYRALDSFEKTGLIHAVPGKGKITRYALCQSECEDGHHNHHHAHLICNACDETFCVDEIQVPTIKLSGGFKVTSSNLTLEGLCPECQE